MHYASPSAFQESYASACRGGQSLADLGPEWVGVGPSLAGSGQYRPKLVNVRPIVVEIAKLGLSLVELMFAVNA